MRSCTLRPGRRRSLYDSCAFAQSLRAAVKGYDPDHSGSFLAYFDTIYERDLYRAAALEQGRRQEGAQPLTRSETNLWKELCRLTEKLGLDPCALPARYCAALAYLLGVRREQVEAVLRRAGAAPAGAAVLRSGPVSIDLAGCRASLGGRTLDLTAAEYRLLCLLVRNAGRTLTRRAILDALWDGSGDFVDDNTLSVYVRRLRAKIEQDPAHPRRLITVRGFGYRWEGQA